MGREVVKTRTVSFNTDAELVPEMLANFDRDVLPRFVESEHFLGMSVWDSDLTGCDERIEDLLHHAGEVAGTSSTTGEATSPSWWSDGALDADRGEMEAHLRQDTDGRTDGGQHSHVVSVCLGSEANPTVFNVPAIRQMMLAGDSFLAVDAERGGTTGVEADAYWLGFQTLRSTTELRLGTTTRGRSCRFVEADLLSGSVCVSTWPIDLAVDAWNSEGAVLADEGLHLLDELVLDLDVPGALRHVDHQEQVRDQQCLRGRHSEMLQPLANPDANREVGGVARDHDRQCSVGVDDGAEESSLFGLDHRSLIARGRGLHREPVGFQIVLDLLLEGTQVGAFALEVQRLVPKRHRSSSVLVLDCRTCPDRYRNLLVSKWSCALLRLHRCGRQAGQSMSSVVGDQRH